MYCEKCNRIVDAIWCPNCGRKNLRLPMAGDYCFLSEPEPIWTQALSDLLEDNGIEFVTRNIYGVGRVKMTGIPERVRFFVPYAHYARAKELEEAFFSASFEFETE